MKEIEPVQDLRPDTAIYANQNQEYKFFGRITLHPGEKLWQFNPSNQDLTEVSVTINVAVDTNGKPIATKRSTYDPKCIYVKAINQKNAIRKLKKAFQTA